MIPQCLTRVSPEAFHGTAGRIAPVFGWAAVVLVGAGLAIGLALASTDATQGDTFRIAVMHYPAAWVSLAIYSAIGGLSIVTLARHSRLTPMLAGALAPTGVLFTFLALWTGALWHKPLRGVWWVWDAEAVSQLLLLFLYAGFIGVKAMIDDPRRADRAGALLAIIGMANLPVMYFSVHWWDTLRREAAASAVPQMSASLAAATLMVAAGFGAYAAFAALKRLRCLIAERQALARSLGRLAESAA